MMNLAKNSGLPWDVILGAELARHYKPDKEVYISAAEFLGLKRSEVMMCAAHSADLHAAAAQGAPHGFYSPPERYGPLKAADVAKPGEFDVISTDMLDLAAKMGA